MLSSEAFKNAGLYGLVKASMSAPGTQTPAAPTAQRATMLPTAKEADPLGERVCSRGEQNGVWRFEPRARAPGSGQAERRRPLRHACRARPPDCWAVESRTESFGPHSPAAQVSSRTCWLEVSPAPSRCVIL